MKTLLDAANRNPITVVWLTAMSVLIMGLLLAELAR